MDNDYWKSSLRRELICPVPAVGLAAVGCAQDGSSSQDDDDGASAGGAQSSGTSAGGAAGSTGSGGGGGCGDTTTDPLNCGGCGNTCLSGICTQGECEPAFAGCFDAAPGNTCNDVCASYGAICVASGCEGLMPNTMVTLRSYPSESTCTNQVSLSGEYDAACSASILDVANSDWTECCCR